MRRALLVAVVVAVLAPAVASGAIRTFPAEPIYVSDVVRVEIDVPGANASDGLPGLVGFTNMEHPQLSWKEADGAQPPTLVAIVKPLAPGEATIGPLEYLRSGVPATLPAIHLRVLPDLADGARPVKSLMALSKSNRSPVVMVSTVRDALGFEGGEVTVEWWALGDLEGVNVHRPTAHADVEGIDGRDLHVITHSGIEKLDVLDGRIVRKQLIAELRLYPGEAGTYTVPAMEFPGNDENRTYAIRGRETAMTIRRWSPPVEIEVRPRPATAKGPTGQFEMTCSPTYPDGWPQFNARVAGRGNLANAMWPRFVTKPTVPIAINVPSTRVEQGTMYSEWKYRVHAEKADLGPLSFTYFDPVRGENIELRCDSPALKLTHDARRPPAAPPLDRGPLVGESALMSVEIGGLVFVTIALLVLVRAIRG